MKKAVFVLIPLALLVFMFTQSGSSDEYTNEIEKFREERHDFFKSSQASPFIQNNVDYEPITFFPIEPSYRVRARLERLTTRETVSITNSDGTQSKYLKFARANFELNGSDHSLLILKALGFGNQYLTAFLDETSAISSYGGGRYLDLAIGKSDQIEIDFNKAYNPYCAYVEDYLCPLPPRENYLSTAIEAGEKDYKTE